MKKIKNLNINLSLIMPVILLAFFSLITLKNIGPLLNYQVAGVNFFLKQLIGFCLGAVAIIIIYNINLKKFIKLFNIIYFILVIMLFILVLPIPAISSLFTLKLNGANGWFVLFPTGITFQPVEFFKIALILKLALISKEHINGITKDNWLIGRYLLYGALPIFLVLKEPDLGGVALLGFSFTIMLLFSLKSKKLFKRFIYLIIIIIVFIILLFFNSSFATLFTNLLIKTTPLQSYQIARIDSWLDPFSTDGGYQLSQSLTFIGSAGPFGYGGGYDKIALPEAQTDLIFTVFVGFYGWIPGLILIGTYFFLIFKILSLALLQTDTYFKFITLGFASLFFLQVFENIGMLIGVLPITGIVLPFMSYGISALLTYSIIIGILINISKETDFEPDKYNKL